MTSPSRPSRPSWASYGGEELRRRQDLKWNRPVIAGVGLQRKNEDEMKDNTQKKISVEFLNVFFLNCPLPQSIISKVVNLGVLVVRLTFVLMTVKPHNRNYSIRMFGHKISQ